MNSRFYEEENKKKRYKNKYGFNDPKTVSTCYNNHNYEKGDKNNDQKIYSNFDKLLASNYKKMEKIKNIYGFVVNIKGTLNFDIDLNINHLGNDLLNSYNTVHKKSYEYVDYKDNLEESHVKKAFAYRCRLRGIDIIGRKLGFQPAVNPNLINFSRIDVENLIKNNDRWVICNLYDIDIYNRLLIDLIIVIDHDKQINLCDHLLRTYPHVFCEYNIDNQYKEAEEFFG